MLENLEQHVDITEFSGYQTSASALYFYEFHSLDQIEELQQIFIEVYNQDIPLLLISGGTNMLFAFDTWPGIIIKNSFTGYTLQGAMLHTNSGHGIWELASELEDKQGITIWHRFIGLPGSVGGAIYGNAGCFGLEVENHFVSARFMDMHTGTIEEFTREQMEFEYRMTRVKREGKWFCLDAVFDLSREEEKYASDVDNVYFREHKQPKGFSCGSFFKNPTREQPAGKLIEEVWLKWHHIGGAYFSDLHANFLMSDGSATWQDLLELQQLARDRVREKFGIELINEVQIITP